ncbi:TPA: leu operon leader peptide [Klebsiella oxytoca]|nr:leu operon leader peptide [Klebsiella michiganensis]HBM7351104.1 leu operon leader peptide [Klebsiella oxytoca]HCB2157221.1 leu operon leader peptide [Klebsiella oxytoca]HCD2888554.1 leu operon leader peptide [Klebsiella oxytoca]HCD3191221.1 leu operon leader peptide [Klebsiella oxytoca]
MEHDAMIRSIRFLSLLLLNASILRGRLLGDVHR